MADNGIEQLVRPRRILSVGITGHRPQRLVGCSMTALTDAIAGLLDRIAAAARVAQPSDLHLVSPLAEGADSLVADAAVERGWHLDVVLPFFSEEYASDFPEGPIREEHLQRLGHAARVFELPGARHGVAEAASYERAGRVMLAQSDLVIAIWDGGPVRGRGGAAQIVAEAVAEGLPVIQIDPHRPDHAVLLWDGLEEVDLGQQTVETVARGNLDHLDRLIADLLGPGGNDATDLVRFFVPPPRWRLPGLAFPALMAAAGVRRPRRADFSFGQPRPPDCRELATCHGEPALGLRLAAYLVPRFARADQVASVTAGLLRSGYVRNFALAAFAVSLSMVSLLLSHHYKPVLLVLELATITAILGGTHVGRKSRWHERWLDHRALAERLRCLAIAVQLGDLELRVGSGDAAPWVGAQANATARELGLPHARADHAYLADVRQSLVMLIDSQRGYHANEARRMHRLDHRLHRTGTYLFAITALTCVILLALNFVGLTLPIQAVLGATAAGALLPAIGAAIYGIRMQGDFAGVAERSATLHRQLGVLRQVIDVDELAFDTLSRRVRRTMQLLTGDVASWLSNASVRPLVLPG